MSRVMGDHLVLIVLHITSAHRSSPISNIIILYLNSTTFNALPYVGHNLSINPTVASI